MTVVSHRHRAAASATTLTFALLLLLLLSARFSLASFLAGYPRLKPGSVKETSIIIQLKVDVVGIIELACAAKPDVPPPAVPVPPTTDEVFNWIPWRPNGIVYVDKTNSTFAGELVEIQMVVDVAKEPEDFEVFCTHPGLSSEEIAASHLHMQLLSLSGTYTWGLDAPSMDPYIPEGISKFHTENDGVPMLVLDTRDNGRVKLLDVRLRTTYAEDVTFSMTVEQKLGSDDAFFGFTDGTTYWALCIGDRVIYPFQEDFTDPITAPLGSELNPFSFDSLIDSTPTFTISVTIRRLQRQVILRLQRGVHDRVYTMPVNFRARFLGGPVRCVVFGKNSFSFYRFFRINGTIITNDDPYVTTNAFDLLPTDLQNVVNPSKSAPSLAKTSLETYEAAGASVYEPTVTLPLGFEGRLSDHFSLTVTYNGMSTLDPENDIYVGLTNGSFAWYAGRLRTLQQGYYALNDGDGTAPIPIGSGQVVVQDDVHPYDSEFWIQVCNPCTEAHRLRGIIRTNRGWRDWIYNRDMRPLGPLSLVLLKAEADAATEIVSWIRLELSVVDQFPPYVALTTTTIRPIANRTELFTASFSEAVTNFVNESIRVENAVVTVLPYPTISSQLVQWTFEVEPIEEGSVLVQILSASFQDLSGYSNPLPSQEIKFYFDPIPPQVVQFFPVDGLPAYHNESSLASQLWLAEFSETPWLAFQVPDSVDVINGFARDSSIVPGTPIIRSTYLFYVQAFEDGPISVRLPEGSIRDAGLNGNPPTPFFHFIYDATPPVAVITAHPPRYTSKSALASIRFQVNFSEPVIDFTHNDVLVVNGFAVDSRMLDTEATWFDFEVRANPTFFDGIINVTLPYFATVDRALNGLLPTWFAFEYDDTFPTVDLFSPIRFPTNHTRVLFTATFSEVMHEIPGAAYSVSPGYADRSRAVEETGRLNDYVVEFYVNPTEQGYITVSIQPGSFVDLALNDVRESTYTEAGALTPAAEPAVFLFDSISPQVVITTATLDLTNTMLTYTATFSEEIEYFSTDQVSVVGGVPAEVVEISRSQYEFQVAPFVEDDLVRVDIPHNATVDSALNGNLPSESYIIHYDIVLPTVHITSATPLLASQYTLARFTATFSEDLAAPLTARGLRVIAANVTTFTEVPGTDGRVYVFDVKPVADLVVVSISVPPNAVFDPAGNGNADSLLGSFEGTTQPFQFKYEIVYIPGWPLWLKITVVLAPLMCCLSCIACAFFMWLRLPPLEKVPDEEEEPFDAVRAVEEMRARQEAEAQGTLHKSAPEPDHEVAVSNPLVDQVPQTPGFAGQMRGASRQTLQPYASRRGVRFTTTRSQLNLALSPSSIRVAGSPMRGRDGSVGRSPSQRSAQVFPSETLNSPQAWADRKASPAKQYHDATAIEPV